MLEPMKKSGFSLWKFVGIRFVFRVLKSYMSWLQCASIFIHCWELSVDPINLENHILLLGYFLPLFYYFVLLCSPFSELYYYICVRGLSSNFFLLLLLFSHSIMFDSLRPHGLQPPGSSVHGIS